MRTDYAFNPPEPTSEELKGLAVRGPSLVVTQEDTDGKK